MREGSVPEGGAGFAGGRSRRSGHARRAKALASYTCQANGASEILEAAAQDELALAAVARALSAGAAAAMAVGGAGPNDENQKKKRGARGAGEHGFAPVHRVCKARAAPIKVYEVESTSLAIASR